LLRRTLFTFATRFGVALLNFAVVVLTAQYLGAAGRGRISLLVTDIALLLLFIGLLGGSSLIFLAPRRNVWRLLVPAIGWAVLVCGGGAALVALIRQDPTYALHVGGLSLIQAFYAIISFLLLGRRRELLYNALNLSQSVALVVVLAVGFWGLKIHQVEVFYLATYDSFGVVLVIAIGAFLRLPDTRPLTRRMLRRTTLELARHSRGAHFSNILVFLNYRLGYYMLAAWAGAQSVGVLSVGVALAEAFWLIGRSAAQTQYVDLVNATDKATRLPLLLRAARLTWLLTAAGLIALLLLPAAVLAAIFGPEFGAARPIIAWLAPGVLAMSVGMQLSTWFAGLGQYGVNNRATGAGLAVATVASLLLIPKYGASGAAAASSLSYLTVVSMLFWHFWRTTGYGPRALWPRLADVKLPAA
jgi:O-antigen/teichoic acid export membrane protein